MLPPPPGYKPSNGTPQEASDTSPGMQSIKPEKTIGPSTAAELHSEKPQAPVVSNRELPPVAATPPDKRLQSEFISYIFDQTLLPKHRNDPTVIKFIKAYLDCRSASQAARECGLDTRSGTALKARADIQEAISKITDAAVLQYGYDATEVVERVKEVVNVDPLDMENPDGTYKRMRDIPPELRRAIKEFKVVETWGEDPNGMPRKTGEIISIKFWDKMRAVELLGREKQIFKETKKVEHDISKNMSETLLESKRRGEEAALGMRDVTAPQITYNTPVSRVEEVGGGTNNNTEG